VIGAALVVVAFAVAVKVLRDDSAPEPEAEAMPIALEPAFEGC
jgi:hypothetical protein